MQESEKLRIDKYLWAIRAFKTRSIATEACKAGRVKLEGNNLKASHLVKLGDVYTLQKGSDKKIIEVTQLLGKRVDAKTAINFYKDLTPFEKTYAYKSQFYNTHLSRDKGTGRPTKKDRRDIGDLQEGWFDN
ncbi:MAG: RNA-binding S4 domain-containing protein [Bacteroidetes bacterium]|nr:RNA-binding S4 domain-containing protein [Bacteroidota bacterium]